MEISKLRALGQGTLGTVCLALVNNQVVAIKYSELWKWPVLSKEYDMLKKLDGCNEVIQCFGTFNDFEGGTEYCNLLLEYAPGGSLDSHIKNHQDGRLPENMARQYTLMLLRGLSAIHRKGIVHCDLKPANILVFPNEDGPCQLKIADFGNARMVEYRNSGKLKIVGTPLYMSPESVAVGEITPALDIWSLGCIIIEMVTGKRALQSRDLKDIVRYLVFSNEVPSIPENMSASGRHFLQKCFVRNPKERWTADMLLNHPYMFEIAYPLLLHKVVQKSFNCHLPTLPEYACSGCCLDYSLWSPRIGHSRFLDSFKD
ncbi:hypothetical protein K2173_001157 [Erythroxylum novogranatense]|uniref:Protein kinase domain-containing protein n=1 Tax=Erythroxylum novogranatense TaxID=1862640 RepID=A0AAV8TIG5_9ROSI|nr:hypothetical protein K2173_001157 [Erythroxylum novogranatense]